MIRLLPSILSLASLVFASNCTTNDVTDPNEDCHNVNPTTASPGITNIIPVSGAIGTTITIDGNNFDPSPSLNAVHFGATKGIVTAASSTQISVMVPVGATYEPISVTVGGLTGYSRQSFLVTFPANGGIDESSFLPKVDFVAGPHPWDIAIGDLDGDGKADLAVANSRESSVSVFLNLSTTGTLGSESFAEAIDFELNSGSATSIAIGDLDGDGRNDLAASTTSNTVIVLKNNSTLGTIEFNASQNTLGAETDPRSVAIGDLNNDGKPEVVVVNYDNGAGYNLSIFKNISIVGSEILFSPQTTLDTGVGPSSIAISDLDGDGKSEIVVTNYDSNKVSVFRNAYCDHEEISFKEAVDFNTGLHPVFVRIGDIDGDTKPELVVANVSDNTISVLRNNSSTINGISFESRVDYVTSDIPRSVDIGDLDGDGKPDVVVATVSSDISVFRNNGSTLSEKVDFSVGWDSNGSLSPVRAKIGDLDGDGKPDLAIANSYNIVTIFRNDKF